MTDYDQIIPRTLNPLETIAPTKNIDYRNVVYYTYTIPILYLYLDLDLDSTRIQVDALGHTPTPF